MWGWGSLGFSYWLRSVTSVFHSAFQNSKHPEMHGSGSQNKDLNCPVLREAPVHPVEKPWPRPVMIIPFHALIIGLGIGLGLCPDQLYMRRNVLETCHERFLPHRRETKEETVFFPSEHCLDVMPRTSADILWTRGRPIWGQSQWGWKNKTVKGNRTVATSLSCWIKQSQFPTLNHDVR